MEKRWGFSVLIIILFFGINFISAAAIEDTLHLNIQVINSSGDVNTGTFNFAFNISTLSDCSNVVYSNFSTLTTDSRGIISYYLENAGLNYSDQYWLCYYRDGVLINASKIARNPYAFRAKNTTLSGTEIDINLDMINYNVSTTGTGFFGWIGDLVTRVQGLFVQNIDFTGNINGSGNITTTGMIGIGTETPSQTLDVRGKGNFSSGIYFNNNTLVIGNATASQIANLSISQLNLQSYWGSNGTNIYNSTTKAVGIGTATPSNLFEVYNGGIAVVSPILAGSVAPTYGLLTEGSIFIGGTGGLGELDIYEASPSDEATIRLSNADTGSGGTDGFELSMYAGTSFKQWLYENLPMIFATNNVERMRIGGDGLVNISGNQFVAGYVNASIFNGAWNGSYLYAPNTTLAIQALINSTGVYSTFNQTYHNYALNVSRNWTLDTFNTWNSTWDNNWLTQMLSANDTLINSSIFTYINGRITAINTTANIGVLYNATASMIANLSFNQNILNYNSTLSNNLAWNQSGTNVYLNNLGNNVGIGTSSPTQKLHVEGNLNVTKNMSIGVALVFTDNGGNMVFRI